MPGSRRIAPSCFHAFIVRPRPSSVRHPSLYDSQIKAKFPEGWYDRLAKAFTKHLEGHDPDELNMGSMLFDLYKAWRDENKVGFNRVDLDKLSDWLREHEHVAQR